jgi:hypothetical protein
MALFLFLELSQRTHSRHGHLPATPLAHRAFATSPTPTTCHPEPSRSQLRSSKIPARKGSRHTRFSSVGTARRGICSAAPKGHVNRVKSNRVEERPFMPVRQSFPNRALALCVSYCLPRDIASIAMNSALGASRKKVWVSTRTEPEGRNEAHPRGALAH